MHPICILMFIFAGAILLYAGVVALTRDVKLIPRNHAADMKDPRAYASAFAKALAVAALAPLSAAIYGLIDARLGLAMFPVGLAVSLWLGAQFFRGL